MSFSDLGLDAGILSAVTAAGYTDPTPVQREAIPAALSGADLLVSSHTCSGKTAAFILPALQRLLPVYASDRLRAAGQALGLAEGVLASSARTAKRSVAPGVSPPTRIVVRDWLPPTRERVVPSSM